VGALLISNDILVVRPWGLSPVPARWGSLCRALGRALFFFAVRSRWGALSLARSLGLACSPPWSAAPPRFSRSPRSALSFNRFPRRVPSSALFLFPPSFGVVVCLATSSGVSRQRGQSSALTRSSLCAGAPSVFAFIYCCFFHGHAHKPVCF